MPKYTSVQEIENAAEQHRFDIADFLRSKGWAETYNTPGMMNVWTREWEKQKILAPEDMAVTMQGNIDAGDPDRVCPDCGKKSLSE